MDEQRLERALRQGPPFANGYVPSSLALDQQPGVRGRGVGRLVLIIAVTALLLVGTLAGLAVLAALRDDAGPIANGWVAFAQSSAGSAGHDIYLVREGQPARRIIGSDSDGLDQTCPAFSPDGARLAHGEAEDTGGSARGAALVISDLDAEGNASESLRIDLGEAFPAPCAIWSADGRRVAFAVPLTSPRNPTRSAAGSEVWVATVADGHIDVLPDLLATDLEWSPYGAQLAIASGQTELVRGESLRDGSIRLYDADRGDMRTLVGTSRVSSLTWSPDGTRIAYQRGASDGGAMDQEIWVAQVDGSGEHRIASRFAAIRGIGPVWSPTGDRIVYQRAKSLGTEAHDVVLVTLDGGSEVVLPDLRLPGNPDASASWRSWRPSGVTWSPDGTKLLYTVWRWNGGLTDMKALVSFPLDPDSGPAVLHQDTGITNADGERSVPIQVWGEAPR